jgi:hypothetical protein
MRETCGLGPGEAHHVSRSPEEDCGVSTSEMGKVKGAAEKGGLVGLLGI